MRRGSSARWRSLLMPHQANDEMSYPATSLRLLFYDPLPGPLLLPLLVPLPLPLSWVLPP